MPLPLNRGGRVLDQIISNLSLLVEYPIFNLDKVLQGLMIGGIFVLAAYGLALVWGVMNVKNLAQGDYVIFGGYLTWWMAKNGLSPFVGMLITIVIMWFIGWITYKLVIRRVIERDLFTSLLATFGLGIMMAQIMNLLFGSDTQTLRLDYDSFSFFDDIVQLPVAKLIGAILAGLLAVAVIIFMKRSRMGQAIRATAQDARAARVLGIDTEKVYAFTFSLNSAICGAAGSIIVMVWEIQPFYGITYSVRSFVIVTAAGLGNLPGVISAGYGMGILEQYGAHIFGIGYQQAIVVLLLLFVLLYRLMQQRRHRQVLQ